MDARKNFELILDKFLVRNTYCLAVAVGRKRQVSVPRLELPYAFRNCVHYKIIPAMFANKVANVLIENIYNVVKFCYVRFFT